MKSSDRTKKDGRYEDAVILEVPRPVAIGSKKRTNFIDIQVGAALCAAIFTSNNANELRKAVSEARAQPTPSSTTLAPKLIGG